MCVCVIYLPLIQLHRPCDEGLDQFWVDFNFATSNLSLYTEDLNSQGNGVDGMWESVIIKNNAVKEWNTASKWI